MSSKDLKRKMSAAVKFDTLESLTKRYGIVLKAGFRNRDKITNAVKKMDALRGRTGTSKRRSSAESIIRKWREKR